MAMPYGKVARVLLPPEDDASKPGDTAAMPRVCNESRTPLFLAPIIAPMNAPSSDFIGPSQAAAAAKSFTSPAPSQPNA